MDNKQSLRDWLKGWIGHIGYSLFLWSINMTNEEFIDEVYYSEKYRLTEEAQNG
jgi:hypothetical protein